MTFSAADEWFVATTHRPDAVATLAGFPQAGAGCSAFAQQAKVMPDWLELMTLNLPGRQARFGQPLRTDINSLATELGAYWEEHPRPFVFFGYCSGALLAYCVARDLWQRGATMPRSLIVGSYKAPHLATRGPLADLDSDTFWKFLADNQAVPSQVLDHPELRRIGEPVLRADLELVSGYRHAPAPSLPIPITALVGGRDSWLASDDIAAWARYTAQGLEIRSLPTGHWFMEEDAAAAAEVLVRQAAAVLM